MLEIFEMITWPNPAGQARADNVEHNATAGRLQNMSFWQAARRNLPVKFKTFMQLRHGACWSMQRNMACSPPSSPDSQLLHDHAPCHACTGPPSAAPAQNKKAVEQQTRSLTPYCTVRIHLRDYHYGRKGPAICQQNSSLAALLHGSKSLRDHAACDAGALDGGRVVGQRRRRKAGRIEQRVGSRQVGARRADEAPDVAHCVAQVESRHLPPQAQRSSLTRRSGCCAGCSPTAWRRLQRATSSSDSKGDRSLKGEI